MKVRLAIICTRGHWEGQAPQSEERIHEVTVEIPMESGWEVQRVMVCEPGGDRTMEKPESVILSTRPPCKYCSHALTGEIFHHPLKNVRKGLFGKIFPKMVREEGLYTICPYCKQSVDFTW